MHSNHGLKSCARLDNHRKCEDLFCSSYFSGLLAFLYYRTSMKGYSNAKKYGIKCSIRPSFLFISGWLHRQKETAGRMYCESKENMSQRQALTVSACNAC